MILAAVLAALATAAQAAPSTQQVAAEVECGSRPGAEGALCLAVSYSRSGRFAEAAAEFEKAAQLAGPGPHADRALAAAGNMWIGAGQPGKAALALDRALAGAGLQAEQRGEALLDRARAAEAQNDLKTARAKLNEAAASVSSDPFYWYFSAALAIREGDKAMAEIAIGKALTMVPNDPTILFEAGHVAHFVGDDAKARDYWRRAIAADPKGPVGKSANEAIALLAAPPVTKEPAATK